MNLSHDDDAELQRAIALSLNEAGKSSLNAIEISDDSDDDEIFQADLRRAVTASKTSTATTNFAQGSSSSSTLITGTLPAPTPTPTPATNLNPFLAERAQLERARLERQKRLRNELSVNEGSDPHAAKRRHVHVAGTSDGASSAASSRASSSSARSSPTRDSGIPALTTEELFWEGELRPVANMHAHPREDGRPTFRLTEILGKKTEIAFAVMSSFALAMSWIYQFFDPSTPVIMVAQPDQSGSATIKNVFPNWIRTTPFLRNGRGCMHMKFMLLFYKTGRLRVVVSTANLVDFDWRDIENMVWLQDVPMRETPIARDPKVLDDFPTMFQRVLHAVNVRPALQNMLKTEHPDLPLQSIEHLRTHWDWSKVKAYLVPSVAGKHEGWPQVVLTGHTRLMMVVRNMGLRVDKGRNKELGLECQGSSIGTYSTNWMNEFYWSARGLSAEDWLDEPRSRRSKLPWPPIKVIFPTLATVQQSVLGEPGGRTTFCRRNQWEGTRFPRELFYNSKSKAGRVLMHSKMIIGTIKTVSSRALFDVDKGKEESDDSDTETDVSDDEDVSGSQPGVGWVYVGSHNFTPSAWGTLSGSSFNPVLNVVNYELGVVFSLRDEKEVDSVACFERPPKKYRREDRPWMQEESEALQHDRE